MTQEVLTTDTDYVNRYPSILQTISYNFAGTNTIEEQCAVFKGAKIYPKNQTEHVLISKCCQMLQNLVNPSTGNPKRLECVCVNGATDEGPSHDEVKFWWAARHLKRVTMVTSRSSRTVVWPWHTQICSYLQPCLDLPSGELDMDRVRNNLELATSVYIH